MDQMSMFANTEPVQVPMFTPPVDTDYTLWFVGEDLHIAFSRGLLKLQRLTLQKAIRTIPGVQSCTFEYAEHIGLIVTFNRYTEQVRLAIRSQIDLFAHTDQPSLFTCTPAYTVPDWRQYTDSLPF